MNKKFALIEVVEREIDKPTFFNTHEEAYNEMLGRLATVLNVSVEELKEYDTTSDEYIDNDYDTGFTRDSAWTEKLGENYDWRIHEVNI